MGSLKPKWAFLAGWWVCLILVGCAGFTFRYYGLEGVRYEDGKLLGAEPKDDLPFSACAPDGRVKQKCVVMFVSEFFKLKTDYEDTKEQLKQCQQGD